MPIMSWKGWPALAASSALLALTACASNSVETPVVPRLESSLAKAQGEQGRYGTLLRLASATRAAGDPAASVAIYQQAIATEQGRPEAYVLLGDALIELKAYDDAANSYEQALKRDPDNLGGHRGYGRAMLALNRPEAALVHYQAVVETDPRDIQGYNGLGVANDLAGQHAAAQDAYRKGLEIAPDSMLLRNNLGLSLALAGEHDEAIALLRAVVDEPGAKARNRQNLALAYGLAGNLAAAERISRLDLDEQAVENNLSYYAALAALEDGRKRATALGVHSPELADHASDPATNRRLTALALEGDGLELGLVPTGRWFVNLGDYQSGQQASSAWRRLRAENQDLLGQLSRLAGAPAGRQPLLVGPLANAEQAQALCGSLKLRGHDCQALAL